MKRFTYSFVTMSCSSLFGLFLDVFESLLYLSLNLNWRDHNATLPIDSLTAKAIIFTERQAIQLRK
jgi:hypothetical protein